MFKIIFVCLIVAIAVCACEHISEYPPGEAPPYEYGNANPYATNNMITEKEKQSMQYYMIVDHTRFPYHRVARWYDGTLIAYYTTDEKYSSKSYTIAKSTIEKGEGYYPLHYAYINKDGYFVPLVKERTSELGIKFEAPHKSQKLVVRVAGRRDMPEFASLLEQDYRFAGQSFIETKNTLVHFYTWWLMYHDLDSWDTVHDHLITYFSFRELELADLQLNIKEGNPKELALDLENVNVE
jgi:hypothetical protein